MIIKILSKVDLADDNGLKAMAIENILKAHGERKHHVWMPIEVVRSFLGDEALSLFSRRVVNELMGQVNEELRIHEKFEFHAVVDFFDKHRMEFSDGKLIIGYRHFTDSSATQEAVLLSENELDGMAFLWGAKAYLSRERIPALSISVEIQPGGGNTTFDNFERLERGKRFFACIIDSDKSHPKASLGDTAARFNSVAPGYVGRRYFEILSCHEIENIIPVSIVQSVYPDKCEKSLVYERDLIEYRAYPDHKHGVSVRDAIAEDMKHKDNYWRVLASKEQDDSLCAGFGAGMLKACVELMDRISPRKAVEYVNEDIDREWLRISKIVASWGVGSRGLRS